MYAGTVNKECKRFKISFITDAQFKCLLFVWGLRSAGNAEVQTRILSKIEQNLNITQQQVVVSCQRYVNLKNDSHIVLQSISATTSTVNAVQKQQNHTLPSSTHKKRPSDYRKRGGWNFTRKRPFKTHRCC